MPAAPEAPARFIVHLDMDCFYVSVERLLDPSLVGVPVAVGGSPDGRGVVASASYEARRFGVRSAMPMAQAVRLCPSLRVVRGTYSRYAEHADRVREALGRFTPLVQMASQDEAYCDLTGTERLWGPGIVAAQRLREAVCEATSLPCSVGAGSNKLVAKVASGLCKPLGFLYVPHGSESAFLAPLPVGAIPGIGTKSVERLREIGIERVADLQARGRTELERLFGEQGAIMHERAMGENPSPVAPGELPKSLSAEETLARDSVDGALLDGLLSNLAEKVAYRLRREGATGATVTLKYRYADFETHTAAMTLEHPTADERELLSAARRLLASHWQRGRAIRLLGLGASNLVWGAEQLDLLDGEQRARTARLLGAIDAVRERHGYGAVRRGSSTAGRHEEKNDKQWG